MDFYNFGDFIFPIFEGKLNTDGSTKLKHFHGTGFFIGTNGYFLTAGHVLSNKEIPSMVSTDRYYVATINDHTSKTRNKQVLLIDNIETYSEYDISLGKVNHTPEIFFSSRNQDAYGWEDVHCFGYPESISKTSDAKFTLEGQFLKGYITRRLLKNSLGFKHPPAHLINFPFPLGVSGAPIFRIGNVKSLLGIALKSHDTITDSYEYIEIQTPEKTHIERTSKVVQHGVALRIHELRDWKPKILNGKKLSEIY